MTSSRPVWRRLTYGPRFVRHYWHRIRGGYTLGHALDSTRQRMRSPSP
jgi:hypothetical protein